jgi:hypothetical protein
MYHAWDSEICVCILAYVHVYLMENLKGTNYSGDLDVDGKKILD